jgi:hypothetical protein
MTKDYISQPKNLSTNYDKNIASKIDIVSNSTTDTVKILPLSSHARTLDEIEPTKFTSRKSLGMKTTSSFVFDKNEGESAFVCEGNALAYDFQIIQDIESESHDIKVDFILTNKGFIKVNVEKVL